MEAILQTCELTKRFGRKTALDRVSMTVNRGDIYGFIGGNGAGKTTLMRLALNLAFPSAGQVSLFGGESFATAGRRIGSLIEAPAFYRGLSARENLLAFGSLVGADPAQADTLLARVSLGEVGKKKAGSFSLGMKQRLGLAIALLGQPELIILDEPVNGLDPAGIRDVRDLILEYNREKGVTFLISSICWMNSPKSPRGTVFSTPAGWWTRCRRPNCLSGRGIACASRWTIPVRRPNC